MQKDYQIRIEDEAENETVKVFTNLKDAETRYEELLAETPPNDSETIFELIEVLRQDCRKG